VRQKSGRAQMIRSRR